MDRDPFLPSPWVFRVVYAGTAEGSRLRAFLVEIMVECADREYDADHWARFPRKMLGEMQAYSLEMIRGRELIGRGAERFYVDV